MDDVKLGDGIHLASIHVHGAPHRAVNGEHVVCVYVVSYPHRQRLNMTYVPLKLDGKPQNGPSALPVALKSLSMVRALSNAS
jgi:hypothetical protein